MNQDQKLIQILQQRGYLTEEYDTPMYKKAMQQFIRDRVHSGQYTQVFSSHQPEPDPEQESSNEVTQVRLPWYKRLFVRSKNGS